MYCQRCGQTSKGSDRVADWWNFNSGHLCKPCKNKYLKRDLHETELIKELQAANHSVAERDAEIIRLKAKISALESELRVRKTREEEKCKKP